MSTNLILQGSLALARALAQAALAPSKPPAGGTPLAPVGASITYYKSAP